MFESWRGDHSLEWPMHDDRKAEKIRLMKRIIKGKHRCMICASGASRYLPGRNQFVRLRRSRGC